MTTQEWTTKIIVMLAQLGNNVVKLAELQNLFQMRLNWFLDGKKSPLEVVNEDVIIYSDAWYFILGR